MANMESLPVEILDMILNGLDADNRPFLNPQWRFAARTVHSTWRDVIASAESTKASARAKAFRRAWWAPSEDSSGDKHSCHCAYDAHGDFEACLVSGRLVSARCAVGRPWVLLCCAQGLVLPQDRTAIALLSTVPPIADAALVRDLVAPHIEGDESTGSFPLHPLRRDFWDGLTRAQPDGGDDDAGFQVCDSEFLYDMMDISCEWNRPDLVRVLMAAYPGPRTADNVLFCACYADNAEVVQDALLYAHALDDGDKEVDAVHRTRLWKQAVRYGGARVLERLLDLCAGESVDGIRQADTTLATIARLTRPQTDLSWQKCAVRCGNLDALAVGERHGIAVRAHELIEIAASREDHQAIQWLLSRAVDTPGPSSALADGCALALVHVVAHADRYDAESKARDFCLCRGREPPKPSSDDDEDDAESRQSTIDALCGAMAPAMQTDGGIVAARRLLNTYLARDQHAAAGVDLVARVLRHWETSIVPRIKPRGWDALVRAATVTGAFDALDAIVALAAAHQPSALASIDLWTIAVDHMTEAVQRATPPLPPIYCGKCPARSLPYERDRAADALARILGALHGTAPTEAPVWAWRVLCRPRPIALAVLGDQDSLSLASLRAPLETHGLLYP